MLIDKWTLATSGDNDGEARRNSSLSSDTMTVTDAYTNTVATAVTYEMFAYRPALFIEAIQQALRQLMTMDLLYLYVIDETIIVDNILLNPSFEVFAASSFTNWDVSGGPTEAIETAIVVHGVQSAKITPSGATGVISQNRITAVNPDEVVGRTLEVRGWVRADTADSSRIRATFDGGSTYSSSPKNVSINNWEGPGLQTISAQIPSGLTTMTISFEVDDSAVGYADLFAAWVDPINDYTMPTAFYPIGPSRVFQQADMLQPKGLYLPISGRSRFISGRVLRLEGDGRLTIPSVEADTVELDETQLELVVALAARNLFRALQGEEPGNKDEHRESMAYWQGEFESLVPSGRMMHLSAHEHDFWSSGVTASDNTRRFRLHR